MNMSLKELYIFMKYKDKCFKNAATLKGEITKKYKGVDVQKLYVKIINYQVSRYGGTLVVERQPRKAKPNRKEEK